MRRLILMVGLAALVLLVGCPIDIGLKDRGTCSVRYPGDDPDRHPVPCSWCEQGAGMIDGRHCFWEPDEPKTGPAWRRWIP